MNHFTIIKYTANNNLSSAALDQYDASVIAIVHSLSSSKRPSEVQVALKVGSTIH